MKKQTVLGLVFVSFGLLLSGCGNKLSINVDEKQIEAASDGSATITGKVEGEGTLFVDDKKYTKQPSKDGKFEIEYKVSDVTMGDHIEIEYIDAKDNSNKVTSEIDIEPNAEALEKFRQEKAEEEAKQAEEAKKKQEEAEKQKQAEEAKMKKTGYTFEVSGDQNNEGKHVISKYEAGTYTIECTFVPKRDDFEQYYDYSDLTGYITVFTDDGKYDSAMDADKAIYDLQLTSPQYLSDVRSHYDPMIETKTESVTLSEGNQVLALNCTIKVTME